MLNIFISGVCIVSYVNIKTNANQSYTLKRSAYTHTKTRQKQA